MMRGHARVWACKIVRSPHDANARLLDKPETVRKEVRTYLANGHGLRGRNYVTLFPVFDRVRMHAGDGGKVLAPQTEESAGRPNL